MKEFKISFNFEADDNWLSGDVKDMIEVVLEPIYHLGDASVGELEVEEAKSLTVKEYTRDLCGRTFFISECPKCGCGLDGNQVQKYCHECGQKLEWEQ